MLWKFDDNVLSCSYSRLEKNLLEGHIVPTFFIVL